MYRQLQLFIFTCSVILLTLNGCSAAKRLEKAKIRLDSGLESTRGWPYNYTFQEYANRMDNANMQLAFYQKKHEAAEKSKDKTAVKVMAQNIKTYEKDIERLKADKAFYKVYKLHAKVNKDALANEASALKELEKQKKSDEKAMTKKKQGIIDDGAGDYDALQDSKKQMKKALKARKK